MKLLFLTIYILTTFTSLGLGIDWGNEYHKSTLLIPGRGYVMVENTMSKRKSPSAISICQENRFFENDTLKKFSRNTCQTFYAMNRFWDSKDQDLDEIIGLMPSNYFENHGLSLDEAGFKFTSELPKLLAFERDSKEHFLRLEELFAMMIDLEKKNAEKTSSTNFKGAVFTIPDNNMSILARKRLGSAIKLSGMQTLAFVHENTAAATFYSADKNAGEKDLLENILVVNSGAHSLKLSLMSLKIPKEGEKELTVIKDFTSTKFSGHKLDICLAELSLETYNKLKGTTLTLEGLPANKARRLLLETKKIKEILTVNKEFSYNIVDFPEDQTFGVKISRENYYDKCAGQFLEFENILKSFLSENPKIDVVEAIGGVTRTPMVISSIQKICNKDAAFHINFEEGAAHGAAFIAASMMNGVRMKKVIINDGPNYGFDIEGYNSNDKTQSVLKEQVLFAPKTNSGTVKKLELIPSKENVTLSISQKDQDYKIDFELANLSDVEDQLKDKEIKDKVLEVDVELTKAGLARVSAAVLKYKETVKEKVPASKNKDDAKAEASKENEEQSKEEEKFEEKTYERKKTIKVKKIYESIKVLSDFPELFKESERLLKELNKREKDEAMKSQLRNKLESLKFKLTFDLTEEKNKKFLTESEQEDFIKQSEEADTYLESNEIKHASIHDLEAKVKTLENLYKILGYRLEEFNDRDETIKKWKDFLADAEKQMGIIEKDRKWVPTESIENTREKISSILKEVEEKISQAAEMPLNTDPEFNKNYAYNKSQEIVKLVNKLMDIKKPEEKKIEKKPSKLKKEEKKDKEKTPSLEELQEMINKLNPKDNDNLSKDKLDELIKQMKDLNIDPNNFMNKDKEDSKKEKSENKETKGSAADEESPKEEEL